MLLLALAVKNTDTATLRLYFDVAWQAPLVVVMLLAFFAAGALFGLLAALGALLRQRREIGRLRREARARAAPAALPAATPPPPTEALMEFEFWWLLALPLFFGLGWLAARIDIKHLVSESRALPRSYFKGLNFLLNEQPDKAIEAFIEVVKVDPETVELHFALGSLFRRRGETDRAIRMHQNLLERVGPRRRAHARRRCSSSAQDYLKAGMLDRAEEVFARLAQGPRATDARRHLLEIYQQEKDWPRAIAMAERLQDDSGESRAEGDLAVPVRAGGARAENSQARRGAAPPRGGAGGEPQVVRASIAARRPRAGRGP